MLLRASDRPEAALQMAADANEVLTQTYGEEHWRTAWARSRQGAALADLFRFAEAEPLLVDAYETLRSSGGARPVHVRTTLESVASLYLAWGRPEDAASYQALLEK